MKARISSRSRSLVSRVGEATAQRENLYVQPEGAAVRPQANLTRFDVLSRIVDLITDLKLPQGQFTSELELAKLLGLPGRTPSIREALALLARDGLVQPFPQRGYYVPHITAEQAEEILVLRLSIFKAIVTRLTAPDFSSRLGVAEKLCGGLNAQSTQSFLKEETAYWSELARQGGFIFAVQNLNSWGDQLRVFHAGRQLPDDIINKTAGHYRQVLEHIREQNSAGAIAAVQENFNLRRAVLVQVSSPAQTPDKLGAVSSASAV